MREYLAPLVWSRHRFVATVHRRGWGERGRTVCLQEVACAESGQPLCGHVWVPLPDPAILEHVAIGDRIGFRATMRPYTKGDGTEDYHLTGLRHVGRIDGAGEC